MQHTGRNFSGGMSVGAEKTRREDKQTPLVEDQP